MKPILEKIKSGGMIELPKKIMENLHLKVGEEVQLRVRKREVLIKPKRSIVGKITGSMKLDQKLVDELVEKEELFEPEV